MKMINKILAVLLVLVMVAAMLPMALAEGVNYNAKSGTTVSVDLTLNDICGFEIHWSDITYSNKSIITSVTGDGSKLNQAGLSGMVNDNGAMYMPLVSGGKDAVFTLKFAVSGAAGQSCNITVKYKVMDVDADYSREVTEAFTITIISDTPVHTHSYTWKSDENQHWQECSCGDKINYGGHQWEWVIDTPAGEHTSGKKHEECTVCGAKRNENTPIDPTHQHSYGNWVSNENQHWKECACGDKIQQGNHNWEWVIDRNPGEFTTGLKHEECTVCNLKRNENTPINATHQHSYSGWKSDDNQHWKECSCGDKISLDSHNWEWVIDSNPGEFTNGMKHEECTVCGKTRNENTPIGQTHQHSYSGWKGDDNQHWKECSCGDKISVGAHQWGWVIDTNPGEFTPGKKHEECSVCGKTRNLNTPIDPTHQHSYSGWKTDDAQHWKECSCGLKIDLGGHQWSWKIDRNPGEFTSGLKHQECDICGLKRNENTPIDPSHQCQFGDWKYDNNGHWKECACGEKNNQGAHTFGNWVTTKYPTATEPGVQERVCSICGAKQTKRLDPTGGTTDPSDPTNPSTPTTPVDPSAPTDPNAPTDPSTPTDPTTPGEEDPSTPTKPGDPTTPTVPGDDGEGDGCCWWCWLLLILLLIIIAVVVYIYYKKRKEKNAKRRPNPLKD